MKVYSNIYLVDKSGDISQVDFIAIDENVIYVIEVKSFNKCIIKGNVNSKTWTICYRRENVTMLNPVIQNEKHIRMLKSVTGLDLPCKNIIVVPNTATYDLDNANQKDIKLTNMSNLWYVLTDNKFKGKKISDENLEHVDKVLKVLSRNTYDLSLKHKEIYYK